MNSNNPYGFSPSPAPFNFDVLFSFLMVLTASL